MDQLINMISERTGISVDQARQATEMVIGFLKDKLPAPIASQVDNVMSGQGAQPHLLCKRRSYASLISSDQPLCSRHPCILRL